MERMKRLSEKSETNQITQEELSKRFETVETQSAELAAAPLRNSALLNSDIGPFIDDPSFIYQDFAKVWVFCNYKNIIEKVLCFFQISSSFRILEIHNKSVKLSVANPDLWN